MNPKFDDPLYFRKDANGKKFLEACGPINFEAGDLMAVITEIQIQDGTGTIKKFKVTIDVGAGDTMWEVDLTDPGNLQAGPGAGGTGTATVTRRTGDPAHNPNTTETRTIQWTGTFELINPTSFLANRIP
jgi:hypothetical protein